MTGYVVITVPSDKADAAEIEILDCLYPYDQGARFSDHPYRGLLLLETSLDPARAARIIRGCPTSCLFKVIPIDRVVESDVDKVAFAAAELVAAKSRGVAGIRVSVECVRRGRHLRSSREVEARIGAELKEGGHVIDLENPDLIVRIDIIGERTMISVNPTRPLRDRGVDSMKKLKVGKVPSEVLRSIAFGSLGVPDPSVILGPNIGEDAALIRLEGGVIAYKTDPITGSVDDIGWLCVHVNANDIATRGAVPRWFIQCILLPEGSSPSDLEKISRQIDAAAREIGVSVVGGHTEVTPGIERPIVIGSMIGIVRGGRFLSTRCAEAGNLIYMTKSAGLEGTAILSSDRRILSKFGHDFAARCRRLLRRVSVVRECMILSDLRGVTSLHDLTEGGLLGGVWELAEASSSGVRVDLRKVPVLEETALLCRELGLDPYRLISSGSVIFTAERNSVKAVEEALSSAGVDFALIGEVCPASEGRIYIDPDGSACPLPSPDSDELWKGRG